MKTSQAAGGSTGLQVHVSNVHQAEEWGIRLGLMKGRGFGLWHAGLEVAHKLAVVILHSGEEFCNLDISQVIAFFVSDELQSIFPYAEVCVCFEVL